MFTSRGTATAPEGDTVRSLAVAPVFKPLLQATAILGVRCSRGMLWLPGQNPCTPAQDLPPAPGRPQTATPPSYRAAHHRRGCGGSVLTEFSFTQDDTAHWDVIHQTLHKWARWVHISTSLCVYLFDNDHVLICHTRRIGSIKDSPLGKQSPTINNKGGGGGTQQANPPPPATTPFLDIRRVDIFSPLAYLTNY